MSTKYFAYGMNTNTADMQYRCPAARIVGPAILNNYRLDFNIHADINFDPNSKVHGVLWDITEDCLKQLDRLEGYPHYYTRHQVTVIANFETMSAWVYEMLGEHKNFLTPSAEYFSTVLEGYQQNNLPTQQLYSALDKCQKCFTFG
jgi:gamma-glutamylcyclotransferase (GGCT)/AIG2-like uncharacterized protein YtfP